jgi:hypothetical protein
VDIVNNPDPPPEPPVPVEEKVRQTVANRSTSYVHPDVHWWHYQALADALGILTSLPPDPRLQAALGYLDRLETDWRVVRPSVPLAATNTDGRHHLHRRDP